MSCPSLSGCSAHLTDLGGAPRIIFAFLVSFCCLFIYLFIQASSIVGMTLYDPTFMIYCLARASKGGKGQFFSGRNPRNK